MQVEPCWWPSEGQKEKLVVAGQDWARQGLVTFGLEFRQEVFLRGQRCVDLSSRFPSPVDSSKLACQQKDQSRNKK